MLLAPKIAKAAFIISKNSCIPAILSLFFGSVKKLYRVFIIPLSKTFFKKSFSLSKNPPTLPVLFF